MLLALITWFYSCTTINEWTLTTYKKEITQVINVTCADCVVLWPVKAEWKKVAISVLRPFKHKIKHQYVLIDFGNNVTTIINDVRKK